MKEVASRIIILIGNYTIMRLKILILSVLFFCTGFANTTAKEYEIPQIRVEVTINTDGTVRITEHRTYVFDGSFSWADYRLPKQGFSAISDIQISENGQALINENSEAKGTFMVEESDDSIRYSWYFNADDEERTFTISYTLEDAVVIGPEWSEFFWNYISADREKSTENLDISINLPETIASDSLYGWTRGLAQQIDLQKTPGTYSVRVQNIDDDEFVKVRTVFPTSVFNQSQVEVTNTDFSLKWAQNDEEAYQKKLALQKEQDAYLAQIGRQVNIAILILSLIVFYVLYRKYGKRHSTSRFSSRETIMIPDRTRPAPVGWLTSNRQISGGQVMATFLDLARRGYFKIQEEPPEEGFFASDPTFSIERTDQPFQDDLLEWEKILIEFVEEQLEEDNHKLHEIFKETTWFSDWKNRFKEFCFAQGWIDLESYTGAYWNTGLQLLLVTAGIAVAVLTEGNAVISTLFTVAITITASIMSLAIIRRTEKGEEVYHQWKNYREGLKNASEYTIKSDKLDQHFIYAVAMGVGKKPIEKLFNSTQNAAPTFAWFVFTGSDGRFPASIASTFSTLGATGAASAGGAAGGAGASAGAAGGGAAGGAG